MVKERPIAALVMAWYHHTLKRLSCKSHFNTIPPHLYLGLSNGVLLTDLPVRNTFNSISPTACCVSNKYHYVTAEPLGLASIHRRIQYFTSAVLAGRLHALQPSRYLQSKRTGGRMCRRQLEAAEDHGYPRSVISGSILLESYRHVTVTQALARKISSTVNTYSYVSDFEDRTNQPKMCSRVHLVSLCRSANQQLPYILRKAAMQYRLHNSSPLVKSS